MLKSLSPELKHSISSELSREKLLPQHLVFLDQVLGIEVSAQKNLEGYTPTILKLFSEYQDILELYFLYYPIPASGQELAYLFSAKELSDQQFQVRLHWAPAVNQMKRELLVSRTLAKRQNDLSPESHQALLTRQLNEVQNVLRALYPQLEEKIAHFLGEYQQFLREMKISQPQNGIDS